MDLSMDLLDDVLITRPIQMGWEYTIEPYLNWQFGLIDSPDCQSDDGSAWTLTQTRSDGPEPLLTLVAVQTGARFKEYLEELNLKAVDQE
jgi:hypothetical protein